MRVPGLPAQLPKFLNIIIILIYKIHVGISYNLILVGTFYGTNHHLNRFEGVKRNPPIGISMINLLLEVFSV